MKFVIATMPGDPVIISMISYFEIFNDKVINVKRINNSRTDLENPERFFNTASLELLINASENGRIFLRYNLISDLHNWDNNFSQFQFGYSFYVLKRYSGE